MPAAKRSHAISPIAVRGGGFPNFPYYFLFKHTLRPVLLAQLLKQLHPKLVDLHNYSASNSLQLKLDNWRTLNRKVLTKLGLPLSEDTRLQLCNAVPGVAERVCHDIMCQHRASERAELERQRLHGCNDDGTLNNST